MSLLAASAGSFNPPPTSRPEETRAAWSAQDAAKRFQSASDLAAGGNWRIRRINVRHGPFQSASDLAAGGNTVFMQSVSGGLECFNPPPTSRPEETASPR